MLPALAWLAAAALARAAYPRVVERRQEVRRPIGNDGLIVGAAPIELLRPNAMGVLLVHGAGDTPQSLAALARYLHQRGFSVRAPLLAGHGRRLSALAQGSAEQWHADIRREFDLLRTTNEQIAVVGLSMGGALAIKLATERELQALVLLSPYVAMPRFAQALARSTEAWGWLLPYFSSLGARSIRDPQAASQALGHGILTPAILRGLHAAMNDAVVALPDVRSPTLVIQSREDNRISPENAERGFALLGAAEKRLVWTNGAGHVITVDFGHQRVFELTADWIESHS